MFELRLLTLNIHKGLACATGRFTLPHLREAIIAATPDLVFLQEVLGKQDDMRKAQIEAVSAQHEYLAQGLSAQVAYGSNVVLKGGHMGNALLSKWPIVQQHNRDVSIPGAEPRGLLHCIIEMPASMPPLHAICVHLGMNGKHRQQQVKALCRWLVDTVPDDAPVVVAGDFNDWRATAHSRLHDAGLREAFVENQGGLARTFPVYWPFLPLDRIYLRNMSVRQTRALTQPPWTRFSDHIALEVIAKWPVVSGGSKR